MFEVRENFGQHFKDLELRSGECSKFFFEDCYFTHCNFSGLNFVHCHFLNSQFESCDLSNTKFSNGRLRNGQFKHCKMLGIAWGQLTDISPLTFEDCKLDFSNFSNLKMKKSIFLRSSLRDCDFTQSDFSESDFRETDLQNARFFQTNLTKSDFRDAQHYLLHPAENKIKGARFSLPEALQLLSEFGIILDQ